MTTLHISPEVQSALDKGQPIVALESTLIAYGLPYPANLETARALEATVGDNGATPATIAILDGQIRIGLDDADLERLATGRDVRKVSRRDIAIAVAKGLNGATTVAATMWIAHRAGIAVFATGGIGGMHRGNPSDVSADLPELAQTPVAVVCAGAKAILDLPATREWLETHSVPILGFGTDEFPAFYTRSSGLLVDECVDSPEEAAAILRAHWSLGMGGVLVCVPIPAEVEIPRNAAEDIITRALAEAEAKQIRGKELTPFLLAQLEALTGRATRRANIALLKNNAVIAARIARVLAR
jgi:pseudouridine-5'-phosphate glycosidase